MQPQAQRWVVVADSPFLPAHGGGEREHLGFVVAAHRAGRLALLVLPGGDRVDLAPYRRLLPAVPVLPVPRRTTPLLLAHPRRPYVVASRPAPPDLADRVRLLAPDATGVVVFSYKAHQLGRALAEGLGLPAVIRQHNREGAYHRALATQTPGLRGWLLRHEARRIEVDERALGRATWVSGTADISMDDATWRASTGAHCVVHIGPFALPDNHSHASQDSPTAQASSVRRAPVPDRVLFMGSLDTATNIVALEWFLSLVWPAVRSARPGAMLAVVGRAPSAALRRRLAATAGVELTADVHDLAPHLSRAAAAVNPVRAGSGVNIKLVDYLDAAIPVVSTSPAVRGLALRAGIDLEIADEATDFAAALIRLLSDPVAAERLAATGQTQLRHLLDPGAGLVRIAALLSSGQNTV